MKKNIKKILAISIVVMVMSMSLFSFSGCAKIIGQNSYPVSDAILLNTLTNEQKTYDIDFSLEKRQVSRSNSDSQSTQEITVQDSIYNHIGTYKRTYKSDQTYDYKYDYYIEQGTEPSAVLTKNSYKEYNGTNSDGEIVLMCDKDGVFESSKSLGGESVDRMASVFYSSSNISRITEYEYSNGEFQYVFEYGSESSNGSSILGSLYRDIGGTGLSTPSVETGKTISDYYTAGTNSKGETMMNMYVYLDRELRITKQVIQLKFFFENVYLKGYKCKSEVSLDLTIKYKW